jgi:dinuclear metal center YbgI/SA1388 family protein
MLLSDLIAAMEQIAPTRLAEPWDNVGLVAGDPRQMIRKVILTIDYTADVAAEAREAKADVVIAYHPPLFSAVKQMTAGSLVFDAIRRGVAIYSPHTALDVAPGGTNDVLADVLGIPQDRRSPLRMTPQKAQQLKLVTFVPDSAVDKVSSALFGAGAGRIGDYSRCSFISPGTGTFYGEDGSHPTVGQPGELTMTSETKLETVVPIEKVDAVLWALRATHPYEEPAFDLVQLASPPEKTGQGRIGNLAEPISRVTLFDRIKDELGVSHLLVAGQEHGHVTRVACCAGSCGEFVDDAITQKAELFLTGEIKHHDALKAAGTGMTVVCVLHSNSERAALRWLQARLTGLLPNLQTVLSGRDRDPFVVR